jgi:hypothetical protein
MHKSILGAVAACCLFTAPASASVLNLVYTGQITDAFATDGLGLFGGSITGAAFMSAQPITRSCLPY